MTGTYRAALIGCGRMGATIDDEVRGRPDVQLPFSHAAGYAATDRVQLVAAADVDEEQLAAARERYDIPEGYADYREMVEAEDPDVLSVATRPGTHLEMVRFAAEHGVPAVYCEKPLCRSMGEADDLVAACEDAGVLFNLGVNRRFVPLYRRVRELVADGEIGELRAVVAHCGGGSALWSLSHAADMLCFLAGDPGVDWVQGDADFAERDLDGDRLRHDPAVSVGHVAFADGVRGYLTRAGGWEFEVDGTAGKIRTLNNGSGATLRREGEEWGLLAEEPFPEVRQRSGTLGCIEDLVAALDGDGSTSAPVGVAATGQEVCLGWLTSHRRGGERVGLPLENRAFGVYPEDW